MAASFVKNLKATDKFLGNIAKLPTAASIERQQLDKLSVAIEKASLWGPEEAACVTEAIGECIHFGKGSKQILLEGTAKKISLAAPEQKKCDRRGLQDYTMLPLWIPDSIWGTVANLAICKDQILHLVCLHAHRCGLVNPTEATFGVIACIVCWSVWSKHETSQSNRYQSLMSMKPKIKSILLTLAKDNPVPNEKRLKSLPHDVTEVPSVLEEVFAKEKKPSQRYVTESFLGLCRSMPLRKTHTASSWFHGGQSALAPFISKMHAVPALMVPALMDVDPQQDSQTSMVSEVGPVLPIPGVVGAPASPVKARPPAPVKPMDAITDIVKADCPPKGEEGEQETKGNQAVKIVPGEELSKKMKKQEKKSHPKGDCLEVLERLKAELAAKKKKKGNGKEDPDVKAAASKGKPKAKGKPKNEKNKGDAPRQESKKKAKRAVEPDVSEDGQQMEVGKKETKRQRHDKSSPKPQQISKPKSEKKTKIVQKKPAENAGMDESHAKPSAEDDIRSTDTKKTFTSRQYHKRYSKSLAEGLGADEAKRLAREAHREAADLWGKKSPS
ncbi:unnamed protein product [Durusdinium trenchii]|uniref:Uncharacterized protein n=2 Tax=Durusdinium trenchii TaxID=1381693 RepID=A0ABP0IUU5_9DINO